MHVLVSACFQKEVLYQLAQAMTSVLAEALLQMMPNNWHVGCGAQDSTAIGTFILLQEQRSAGRHIACSLPPRLIQACFTMLDPYCMNITVPAGGGNEQQAAQQAAQQACTLC